ncbi:hypothetical protein VKT23_011337 [Stygiomarasmius scandens]|uniref:Uncharacterized protein n=1 Tax=Marasmiellus scandens TaxID=2682957 RepID=A0ABR1JEU3_9AGAR
MLRSNICARIDADDGDEVDEHVRRRRRTEQLLNLLDQCDEPAQFQPQPCVPPTNHIPPQEPTPRLNSRIPEVKLAAEFIEVLKGASLEASGMEMEDITRLHNPKPVENKLDPHVVKCLETYIGCYHSSPESVYNNFHETMLQAYPNDLFLSLHEVKQQLHRLSGVIPLQYHICREICIACTRPYAELNACPTCSLSHYHPGTRKPRQTFTTILIGPVIQALYASHGTAEKMRHCENQIEVFIVNVKRNNGQLEIEK